MNAPASLPYFPALPFFGRLEPADPARALERRLRQSVRRGQPLVLGTVANPYEPLRPGATRALLAGLDALHPAGAAEGWAVSITTRSPLLLRDLDLLAELDRRHAVTVHVTLPTVDPALASRLEPGAPDPRARLRIVRQLAGEGIDTRVVCTPVMPGENDGEEVLRPLFAEVREAGAHDVTASAAHLRPAVRDRFLATFRLLRLEHGFPQGTPGRG
ncbi:MAG TPA: radical SAM protein [Thermoanaerobaculia bacterium]|jgi:DNA repair photolyase|nr:radical SAM protein [Thermoanaerobaculia bacterium]